MGLFGKRRAGRTSANQNLIDVLEMLARVEQRIARFYHLCSETRDEEKEFWRKMAASERRHVQHLQQMREIYLENPHQFETDYPFDLAAIRLFELSLRDLPGKSRLVEIGRQELLEIVEKIETSAVEMNYGKVVKSENTAFNQLAARLESESIKHREEIAALAAGS